MPVWQNLAYVYFEGQLAGEQPRLSNANLLKLKTATSDKDLTMLLSIVIPVYNEYENVPILHRAIQDALAEVSVTWEVVYVDDGSSDNSLEALENLAVSDPDHVCVVALRRNFGQTAAIAAGIDHAEGDVVVLMDADLQNDPADIP